MLRLDDEENGQMLGQGMGGQPLIPPPAAVPQPVVPSEPAPKTLKDLVDEDARNTKAKQYMNVLGGVAQQFADVPSANELLWGGKGQHTDVRGQIKSATDMMDSPLDRESKAMEYMKAKRENALDADQDAQTAQNKLPDSNASKAARFLAKKFGIEVPPNATKYEIDQLFDSKKMNEEQVKGNVERENKLLEIQASKKADLEKMEKGKKMDLEKAQSEPPKPDQTTAATFGRRLQQAEQVFKNLKDKGFNRSDMITSSEAKLPGIFQGEDMRSQDQAERNFVNAVLRRESGAAIAPSEFTSAEQQYFDRPGDTPKVQAQKAANREQALMGLKVAAGRAWNQVPLISPTDADDALKEAARKEKERRRMKASVNQPKNEG